MLVCVGGSQLDAVQLTLSVVVCGNFHDHQTDLGVLESPTLEAATVALAASPQERAAIQSKFKEVSSAASVCVSV